MTFELTPLGISAAHPAFGRHPSGYYLNIQEQLFLIDCGEGIQMQLDNFGMKRGRLYHIFITHLHGDHFFGLIGLLTSLAMNGRTEPITVYSPSGLEEMIQVQLRVMGMSMPYRLTFVAVPTSTTTRLLENEELWVDAFPLKHRIPTVGYRFEEKPFQRNIRPEKIEEYQLSFEQIRAIKKGADLFLEDGRQVPNSDLTLSPPNPRSFAYCSDTVFDPDLLPYVHGVSLLYHESTFCKDHETRAAETMHSTAEQAASIAQAAQVQYLMLGHFSSRYESLTPFLQEAQPIFEQTHLAEEGRPFSLPFRR